MGQKRVGNPPHSSLPPPRPPDQSQFKLKLQSHKEEVATRFSKVCQSMTALAAEQEEFRRELRQELRQLRLSHGEPSLPQPNSNPPSTTVSTPSPFPSVGNPSSPSYCQSQLLKCQLPPPILNCKPQTQILHQKPPASFSLPQAVATPPHTPTIVTTAPHQILPQIHHTPSAKLHERKLKLGRVHPKTRIMSLVTLKRKCRLTFSHQKKTQMSEDSKATWVNHWFKYRLCKSQKQFFGRYYHYVYGPVKFVSEICISRKCGYVSGITLCLALVYEWSRSGSKLNLKYKCANQDYNEVVETMLRGKFDKAFRENGESMSLGVAQFDRKGFDFLLELLLRGYKWTDYNLFRLQLQGLFNEGLHQSVLLPTGDMNLLDLFIKLFVKILIFGTLVGEICNTKLNVEFFGNNMELDGQSFGEPFSSLQFCESPVNLNVLKAQFHSSNKGDFIYVMCVENLIERIVGNASKLSVRQATKGSGKSEFLILDQETNFQQRVSYLENATGLLKNNFGLSFANIALYYGDYEHKQLKFGLVLGLWVYTSRMQSEHEHVIGSYMNQFYNPNCGVKWVRVVHVYNQPSNSSIEVIGFLIAVLELSQGRYDNSTWFLLLNLCSVLSTIDSNIFVIAVTKNRMDKQVLTLSHFGMAWPFNALSFDFHLRTCKPIEQVMVVDYALAILMKERLNSTLSFNIYTAMLPKEFYIGSSFGAMEVMDVKNALLWDKVLTVQTLIKSFSVHNFSSEAFEVNCEMISYSLQLGINPCAVTDNCSFKGFEMENLYELIINDLYKFIGQQCSMLWIISASVKPDLKFLFRVAKNFKPTGNLLSNTLYDVLGVTLITAISFNTERKIIMVMSNPVHEPCKTTCVQVLIEASKTLRLVEDDITKLEGLFDNGPMYFPHSKSASTSLRNFLQLSLEHSKQVKVFSLQVSHKKSICQQRYSYLAESKINQDVVICANTLGMRYWFSWKLLRYANTTILAKNMMIGPQYDLMNGSFSWVAVHKLKEVISNAEQWIEKSCMDYQVGQTVIKFSLPSLSETHKLKFTLVKLKLMELISVFEIASDNEEQGTQYAKSCSGVEQSMKLGSHFEKWHHSNAIAMFGSQCVLGNKAAATIVACGVSALAKQEESTWVCLLLLVYISLKKHEDMLCFKGCGLLGSYLLGTLYSTSYCHAAHIYLLAQSLYETHPITKALYAAFW